MIKMLADMFLHFNPRSREGSDLKHLPRYNFPTDFNPRSREGSDCSMCNDGKHVGNFNPRSREGSDELYIRAGAFDAISIHAPAKGATGNVITAEVLIDTFQSTLPRRERRGDDAHTSLDIEISIHAPAKGATAKALEDIDNSKISIHAPAKGATG